MPCSIEDCAAEVVARGWCKAHYLRWQRHGDPLAGRRKQSPTGLTEAEAFSQFMPGEPPTEGCWDWVGATSRGYGHFGVNGRDIKAHQAAYRIYHGSIPPGRHVLHSCDRPICVQPAHLSLGNHAENMKEAADRRRMSAGEDRWSAKLTDEAVQEIRLRHTAGESLTALAAEYGVHPQTVRDVVNRKTWRHL